MYVRYFINLLDNFNLSLFFILLIIENKSKLEINQKEKVYVDV